MTEPEPAPERGTARSGPRGGAPAAILALASFVVVLDFAGAIILLPSIRDDVGGSIDHLTWVVAGFVLCFAIMVLPAAGLAERYGRRGLFLSGAATFGLASAGAALAPTMAALLAARAVQGIGAAMIETAGYALIIATFPGERRDRTLNKRSVAALAGAALGPVLPGALATLLSWRYLFWLDVVLAGVVTIAAARLLPASRARQRPPKLDVPGLATGAVTLAAVFFAATEGARLGWTSATFMVALAAAAAAGAGDLVIQSHSSSPLVDLGLFRDRSFTIGTLARATTEFTSLGIFLPLSGFLQSQLHYSPLVSGLLLMSVIVGAILSGAVAENLAGRADPRWLLIPGFLVIAAGTFWVAHVSPTTGGTFFIAPLAVTGVGIGATERPAESAAQRRVAAADTASA